MKSKVRHITILVLGMLTMLPGICFAQQATDTLLLNKMWNYRRYFGHELTGETPNMYVRYTLETERRNPSLFLVPSMYSVAEAAPTPSSQLPAGSAVHSSAQAAS